MELLAVIHSCKQCQLLKRTNNIRLDVEDLKNIPIWDQFYKVALNTIRPLSKTNNGN
jgi:hypothetical protein